MSTQAIERLEDVSRVYDLTPDEEEREIRARIALVRSLGGRGRGRALLDVGCNRGFLLAAAQRIGWQPVGVELSPVAAALARDRVGVAVHLDLAEVERPKNGFHLIVAWHVLEHTSDPLAFLLQLGRLVDSRGTIAIQVPSFDFRDQFRAAGRLGSLVCAVHNSCFGEESLRNAIELSGLVVRQLIDNPDDLMLTAFVARPRPRLPRWVNPSRRTRGWRVRKA